MKIAIAVATLFMLPTAAATDAVDCLAYLAADAEFGKAVELYRKAEEGDGAGAIQYQAVHDASEVRHRALSKARTIWRQARADAYEAERQAKKAAKDAFWRAENARKAAAENAFRNAKAEEEERFKALVDAQGTRPRDRAAEEEAQSAFNQAIANRIAAERQIHTPDPVAGARHAQADKDAAAARRRALETADRVLDEAREAIDVQHTQALDAADLAYHQARTRALEAATPIYQAARERAIEAYVSAYANPGPGLYRDVAGYDRSLILKMAIAERELCPE